MDIYRFGEFAILAQCRTFLEAADLLFMSQSTLSKHIMAMERELNCTLIDRTKREVTLTEQGRILLPYAQKITALQHHCRAALADTIDSPLRTITVGSIPIMAPYGITDALAEFQEANPSYALEVIEAEGDELKRRLLREEIDLAFIRDGGESEPEFKKAPFTNDSLIAVLPSAHPLARLEVPIELFRLADENFLLLPEGSFVYRLAQNCCEQAGFSPRVTFTGTRAENIISLVGHGIGISLLMRKPTSSLADSSVVIRDISPTATTSVSVYLKRDREHSEAVTSLTSFLPYRQLLSQHSENPL